MDTDIDIIKFKKRVMRRVYAAWFMRRIAPMALVVPLFIIIAAHEVSREFFVARIFANFTQAITGAPNASLALWGFTVNGLHSASSVALLIIGTSLILSALSCFGVVRNMRGALNGRLGRNSFAGNAL